MSYPRWTTAIRVNVLLLAMFLPNAVAQARDIPSPIKSDSSIKLSMLGDTRVSWMGMTIYEAALWSEDKLFDGSNYTSTVMLSITYRKNISTKRLLQTTDKQWRRLGISDSRKREQWLEQLRTIWPDVAPGDVIACVITESGETHFYSRHTLLGKITDPEFGPGFLAIWLSPESRLPKARRQLLNIEGI